MKCEKNNESKRTAFRKCRKEHWSDHLTKYIRGYKISRVDCFLIAMLRSLDLMFYTIVFGEPLDIF